MHDGNLEELWPYRVRVDEADLLGLDWVYGRVDVPAPVIQCATSTDGDTNGRCVRVTYADDEELPMLERNSWLVLVRG